MTRRNKQTLFEMTTMWSNLRFASVNRCWFTGCTVVPNRTGYEWELATASLWLSYKSTFLILYRSDDQTISTTYVWDLRLLVNKKNTSDVVTWGYWNKYIEVSAGNYIWCTVATWADYGIWYTFFDYCLLTRLYKLYKQVSFYKSQSHLKRAREQRKQGGATNIM